MTKTGYAKSTAFNQAWLTECMAVTSWRETDNGSRIEFLYDDAVEAFNVPAGIDFAGDEPWTDHYNTPTRYAVDDGDGNRLAAGLEEHNAQRVAQRLANDRGEPVYFYSTSEGDEDMTPIEVKPETEGQDE